MSAWIDQENGRAESRAKAREVQGGDGANTETNEVRLATPCVLSIPYLSRAAGHARPSGGGAVRGSRRRRGLTTEGRDLSGRPVERVRCRAAVRGGGRAAPRAVGVGVTRSREIILWERLSTRSTVGRISLFHTYRRAIRFDPDRRTRRHGTQNVDRRQHVSHSHMRWARRHDFAPPHTEHVTSSSSWCPHTDSFTAGVRCHQVSSDSFTAWSSSGSSCARSRAPDSGARGSARRCRPTVRGRKGRRS